MAMGDVQVDYSKLCDDLEVQEQEVLMLWFGFGTGSIPVAGVVDCDRGRGLGAYSVPHHYKYSVMRSEYRSVVTA